MKPRLLKGWAQEGASRGERLFRLSASADPDCLLGGGWGLLTAANNTMVWCVHTEEAGEVRPTRTTKQPRVWNSFVCQHC